MVRAIRDGYASTDKRYKHTLCDSLDAGVDVVGAVSGTPAAGTVRQPVSDEHHKHDGRSDYAGAIRHYEHAIQDGQSTGVATLGAIARTPVAGTIGQPVLDGHYEHASQSGHAAGAIGIATLGAIARTPAAGTIGQPVLDGHYEHSGQSGHAAGAIGHCEHTIRDGWSARVGMTEATEYIGMAWVAEHIKMVESPDTLGSYAGTIRQHVSDGHYECTIHDSINAGLDMAGVADGAYGVTRQTGSALACWL